MYSLLIIDDEPYITDGIHSILNDATELELELYRAYSSLEAIDILDRMKIDIVLTDINMPVMNGLEIQKQIIKKWPHSKTIFLTGYNEFEYIQAAIRNLCVDYVLKTEGEDAIIKAVNKAIEQIESEYKNQQMVENARLSISRTFPIIQSKYLLDIAEGLYCLPEERKAQFEKLEIPFIHDRPVILMIGRVDYWPAQTSYTEKMEAVFGVQKIAEEYLSKSAVIVSVIYHFTNLLWFIQPHLDDLSENSTHIINSERTILFVHGTMNAIQRSCRELFNLSVSIVVSDKPVLWEKTPDKFESLKYTLNRTIGLSNEMLLIDNYYKNTVYENGSMEENDLESAVRASRKSIPLLETYLESSQKEEFAKIFENIIKTAGVSRFTSHDITTEVYYSISALFLSHISRWKLAEKTDGKIDITILTRMKGFSSWDETVSYFRKIMDFIFAQKNDDCLRTANKIFGFIKTYTEQHLSEDLSIARLSRLLSFDRSYLYRLFRQVTGKSLSEYIAEVKAAKARELLIRNDMKISEISAALGFETPSYFTRFFRKYTNLSPQEYRNSLIQTDSAAYRTNIKGD